MFRSVADFLKTADPKPSIAELALIEACKRGDAHQVNGGTLPPKGTPDPDIVVRASLLRLLIMGGTPKCGLHESGVRLEGAHITETLDLRFSRTQGQLILINCRMVEEPSLSDARIDMLVLDGSDFPQGLFAERIKVSGGIFMRGITAKGKVSLSGAEVGGQIVCINADLENLGGYALNAESVKITGHVILRDVSTKGAVSLLGAEIGGQLECDGADFQNAAGDALHAQGMQVLGGFMFLNVKRISGWVDMNSASVNGLTDDADSWAKCSDVILDGFTYDRLQGSTSPRSFEGRRDWLEKGSVFKGEFSPQPYTQLAKVFRAAGDMGEARKVLMERDRLLGIGSRKIKTGWDVAAFPVRYFWDFAQRWLAGYGFAPIRALWAMTGLILMAWALAAAVWNEGSFAPNSDVVLVSPGWQEVTGIDCYPPWPDGISVCDPNPASTWSNDPQKGMDWDSFNAFGYAADLVIPILDLGQTDAWAPSKDRGDFGFHLWWGRWLLAALGWVVTALGAAAVTGIMQRNSPD